MTMDDAVEENPEDYDKYLFIWLQATMIYSVVWGLGGVLDVESREKFDVYYRNVSNIIIIINGLKGFMIPSCQFGGCCFNLFCFLFLYFNFVK